MGKLTCRSAMNKKKTLEYRLNCSRRNLGRNVKKLYLAVLQGSKLISHKFKQDSPDTVHVLRENLQFFGKPNFPLSPCQFQVPVTGTKSIYPYVCLTLDGYMERYPPPPPHLPLRVFRNRIKFLSSINLLSLLGTSLFQAGLGVGLIERGLIQKGEMVVSVLDKEQNPKWKNP